MIHVTQKQAKTIRAIINTLLEGPKFNVAHADDTYRSFIRRHGIIRELNLMLPPNEQVTFARPVVSNADSVRSSGLPEHQTPSNMAEGHQ